MKKYQDDRLYTYQPLDKTKGLKFQSKSRDWQNNKKKMFQLYDIYKRHTLHSDRQIGWKWKDGEMSTTQAAIKREHESLCQHQRKETLIQKLLLKIKNIL